MAITEAFAGSATVTTTELSLPRNASYSSGSPQTTDGVYQVWLDVSDMVGGDELQIRVYEKVQASDTQRVAYEAFLFGPQSSLFVIPSLILMNGWDVTADCLAGTSIVVNWSIRQVA